MPSAELLSRPNQEEDNLILNQEIQNAQSEQYPIDADGIIKSTIDQMPIEDFVHYIADAEAGNNDKLKTFSEEQLVESYRAHGRKVSSQAELGDDYAFGRAYDEAEAEVTGFYDNLATNTEGQQAFKAYLDDALVEKYRSYARKVSSQAELGDDYAFGRAYDEIKEKTEHDIAAYKAELQNAQQPESQAPEVATIEDDDDYELPDLDQPRATVAQPAKAAPAAVVATPSLGSLQFNVKAAPPTKKKDKQKRYAEEDAAVAAEFSLSADDQPQQSGKLNQDAVNTSIGRLKARSNTPVTSTAPEMAPSDELIIDPELLKICDKYSFRSDGSVPYVNDDYSKVTDKLKLTGVSYENEDGKLVETLEYDEQYIDDDGNKQTAHKSMTSSKFLAKIAESDDRLASSKRFKYMTADEKDDTLDHQDREGAVNRNDMRKQLARQERKAAGNQKWRDRVANLFSSQKVESQDLSTNKNRKRAGYALAGAGTLAVAAVLGGNLASTNAANSIKTTTAGALDKVADTVSSAFTVEEASAASSAAESNQDGVNREFIDTVNEGDGITQTIMDWAKNNGMDITPDQAYGVFKNTPVELVESISNTSQQDVAGGIGYDGLGSATIPQSVIENWNNQLSIK